MAARGVKAVTNLSTSASRWYVPTPGKFLFAVLVMQGVLFLSAHFQWFRFNERKGWTVLISVAATAIALLSIATFVVVGRFFNSKSQFSLAALMLLIPVIAIPCGWMARDVERARQQRDSVTLASGILTNPGDVSQNPFTETLGADFFCDVTALEFPTDSITDAHMAKLEGLARLRRLYLSQTQVTDAGLEHLTAR